MYEKEKVICLSKMQDLSEFVHAAEACDFDIDVYFNRTVIDAKSILGMVGIGLKKKLTICYGGEDEKFENVIDKFVVA